MSDTYLAWVISINFSVLIVVLFVLLGNSADIEPIDFDWWGLYEGTIGLIPFWFWIGLGLMAIFPRVIGYVEDLYYWIKREDVTKATESS